MQAIDTQDNQFHDGNGTTELGTILPAWWLNQIQAEILSVLTAAKVAPNKAYTNQMLNAINKLIAGAVVNNLTSSNADKPLSALQGKVLSEQIAAAVSGSFNLRGQLTTQNLNDLHNAENYGVWQNPLNANATTERNYPTNKAGTLLVLPSAYRGQQVYIPFDEPSIWLRDTRNHATQTTWGQWFRLGDDKLGNSGVQTLNGNLHIVRSAWEKLRFVNADGSYWRYETHPSPLTGSNNKRFNFVFSGADNAEQARVAFPDPNGTQTVAYQNWVDDNKVAKSGDTMTGSLNIRMSSGYSGVYLFSNNGGEVRLETVPENQRNDKIFQLADRQGTGAFTVYQFPKATEHQNVAYHSWVNANFVALSGNQTITGIKTFANNIHANSEIHAGGLIATSYRNDWVGFMAKQPTEGKSGFFDVTVNNVLRGGLQIATESDNRYFARLMVTPAGAPNADRRVAGMTVYDTAIHTYAYGWLHEGFVRAGNGVGQEAGHQIRIGWSPQDLRLKVDLDGRDLGNFVLDQQLHTKSTVAVLTGKIAHGGTIPLPAGFTQAQCKWFVSMHNSNPANQTWDLREGGLGNHHTSNIWADGNRVVTCRVYRDVQAGAGGWQNAEANYIIIGVK